VLLSRDSERQSRRAVDQPRITTTEGEASSLRRAKRLPFPQRVRDWGFSGGELEEELRGKSPIF